MICCLGSTIDLFLHPGEFQFADAGFRLRTTLGSCVSIVLWHPQRRLGGMCHYMLPPRQKDVGEPLSGKYADEALELLQAEARNYGTRLEEYEVKLFGGGSMLPAIGVTGASVALRNIQAAERLLAGHGLTAKASSLGGEGYRHVIFDIASGEVWVRHVVSHGLSNTLGATASPT